MSYHLGFLHSLVSCRTEIIKVGSFGSRLRKGKLVQGVVSSLIKCIGNIGTCANIYHSNVFGLELLDNYVQIQKIQTKYNIKDKLQVKILQVAKY